MSKNIRVSLVDPILYQSSYINETPKIPLSKTFWKKFNLLNFIFNILLPLGIIIFVLFVLKDRYQTKLKQKSTNYYKKNFNL